MISFNPNSYTQVLSVRTSLVSEQASTKCSFEGSLTSQGHRLQKISHQLRCKEEQNLLHSEPGWLEKSSLRK